MALLSSWNSLLDGKFSDAFAYLFVPQSVVTESNFADRRLAEEIAADRAAGVVSEDEANVTLNRIQQNAFPFIFQQEGTNVTNGFTQGLQEGADNIGKFTEKTIGTATSLSFRLIPWQVWAIAIVVGLIWLAPYAQIYANRFQRKA